MPPAKRSKARRKSATTKSAPRALPRVEKSIHAAEAALKDLRTELGRGGRDLVKDLDKTLKDARNNLSSLSKTIAKDVGKVQKAATARPAASRARRTTR